MVLLVLCGVAPLTARAEPASDGPASAPHVVLLETVGTSAWFAAQQRLLAELQAVGMRLTLLRAATQLDPRLPQFAQQFDAVASIQVLRLGDSGVVRIWLARRGKQPGGYRHIRLNLRGPDVVSRAVLLAVEVIFSRALEPSTVRSSQPVIGPSAFPLPGRPAIWGLLWGGGPSWVDLRGRAAWLHTVGASVRLFPHLALQAEWFLSLSRHGIDVGAAERELRTQGVRLNALLHPWPHLAPRSGLGVGVAAIRLDPAEPGLEVRALAPAFVVRAQHLLKLNERVGALVASTVTVGLGEPVVAARPVYRPGIDLFLGLDWKVW